MKNSTQEIMERSFEKGTKRKNLLTILGRISAHRTNTSFSRGCMFFPNK